VSRETSPRSYLGNLPGTGSPLPERPEPGEGGASGSEDGLPLPPFRGCGSSVCCLPFLSLSELDLSNPQTQELLPTSSPSHPPLSSHPPPGSMRPAPRRGGCPADTAFRGGYGAHGETNDEVPPEPSVEDLFRVMDELREGDDSPTRPPEPPTRPTDGTVSVGAGGSGRELQTVGRDTGDGAAERSLSRDPRIHVCRVAYCPYAELNSDKTFTCGVTGLCLGQQGINDPFTAGIVRYTDENGVAGRGSARAASRVKRRDPRLDSQQAMLLAKQIEDDEERREAEKSALRTVEGESECRSSPSSGPFPPSATERGEATTVLQRHPASDGGPSSDGTELRDCRTVGTAERPTSSRAIVPHAGHTKAGPTDDAMRGKRPHGSLCSAPPLPTSSERLAALRRAAQETLDRLTTGRRASELKRGKGTSETPRPAGAFASWSRPSVEEAMRAYVRRCIASGQIPVLDDLHNIELNVRLETDETHRRAKAHRIASEREREYVHLRDLAASLVVTLWLCALRSPQPDVVRDASSGGAWNGEWNGDWRSGPFLRPPADASGDGTLVVSPGATASPRRSADGFAAYAAGVYFGMRRGVALPCGAMLVPRCPQLADALPEERGGAHRGTPTHAAHLSAHRGVCALHRCISSVPSGQARDFFGDAIRAAQRLANASTR